MAFGGDRSRFEDMGHEGKRYILLGYPIPISPVKFRDLISLSLSERLLIRTLDLW